MAPNQLLLLPGMDGTGRLFDNFISALPPTLTTITVRYPPERFLSYAELLPIVAAAAPLTEPFVLLAESFSAPLALTYAGTNPPNLAGLVLCVGFAANPVGRWSQLLKIFARDWLFRIRTPTFVLERLLLGENAEEELVQALLAALAEVDPKVMSGRLNELIDCDATGDLLKINIPIFFLQASDDALVPASCLNQILSVKPDVMSAVVQGPHSLLQRNPRQTADLVVKFVRQLGGA